jgi:hypothetical protein
MNHMVTRTGVHQVSRVTEVSYFLLLSIDVVLKNDKDSVI